jgi:ABC-type transporter Mla subunit MlaD
MFNVFSDISKIKDNSGQQVEATKSINTTMIEKSDDINKSINNNSSLMQKLLTDKLNNITISLERAVESLSKGATEEIIKALEQVISDFNSNLTEQFGENFKELNQAVFDLLKWQENYKTQVIDFENSLQNTLSNVEESNNKSIVLFKKETKYAISIFEKLTKSTEYIEKITKDYEMISKVSIELEEILKTNNMQIENFEIHTKSLAKIGEDARLVTNEIKDFSQTIIGSLSNQSEQLSKQSQSVTEMMNEIEEKLPQSLYILNRNLTSLSEHFTKNYRVLLNNLLAEDKEN